MDLLLTPGIYHLNGALRVKRADTIVLGLGIATLVPERGRAAMTIDDVPGVKLSGLLFDAGQETSRALLQIGSGQDREDHARRIATDPTMVQDVFFRVGGASPSASATTALVVDSDNAVVDDIWAWRADHGTGVGWTTNLSDTGVLVNGAGVTAYRLFVEHFQKFNVLWNGERGRTVFFQNEMPYDPPDQAAWSHDGVLGFAAYKVADNVRQHDAWATGAHCFFQVNPSIHASARSRCL
jgi:hypothetical protein